MQIFSEDTKIARSSPAMMASLLEAEKLRRMACSMTSPGSALSCNPRPALVCREVPSTFRVHQSEPSGSISS